MLSRSLVRKKIEKLGSLYDRVKSRLPADFYFKNGLASVSDLLSLEHNIEYIDHSIDMVCDKLHSLRWILYFNGAYKELKKYEKKVNNRRKK